MSYASAVLGDAPVLYWRLGEASGTTAVDATGNGHDGTYNNGPTLGVAGALSGDTDTAATFAAASSQDVRSTYAPNLVTLSLEAWVKGTGNNQSIFGRQGGSSAPFSMMVDTTGKLRFDIKSTSASTPSGTYVDSTATIINDGAWHYVVVTRSGSTVAFYVDGVPTSSVGSTLNPFASGTTGVAVASRGGTPFYNGTVDEAALYDVALSSAQIAAHYAARSVPPPPPAITGTWGLVA